MPRRFVWASRLHRVTRARATGRQVSPSTTVMTSFAGLCATTDLDQRVVADRHALDRLAALRLDHRAWHRVEAARFEVAEDIDRELLAAAARLHHRVVVGVVEEELELAAIGAAVNATRAEA